jgi:23S rRNA (uracil1939-C5)-methyltransferase
VRRVYAIEESASAVQDARINIADLDNVTLIEGRTEEVLATLPERPDALVLDPPRTGCHAQALAALTALRVPKVVYVSCDPATLARDLKILAQGGYALTDVQPIDMFPHTYHIEAVATLRMG